MALLGGVQANRSVVDAFAQFAHVGDALYVVACFVEFVSQRGRDVLKHYCDRTNYRVQTVEATKLVDTETQAILDVHCTTTREERWAYVPS